MSDIDFAGSTGGPKGGGNGRGLADDDTPQSPKEMISAAADTVKQEAASLASSVQDKAQDQIQGKKQVASKTMADFASAIRHAGDELAAQDQSAVGRVVKQAADGLEHMSRTVSEKRPEELLDAVRDFGRSNPTAFMAASVLLGVALGRFAKSSETHRANDRPASGQSETPTDRSAGQESGAYPGASYEPMPEPRTWSPSGAEG